MKQRKKTRPTIKQSGGSEDWPEVLMLPSHTDIIDSHSDLTLRENNTME